MPKYCAKLADNLRTSSSKKCVHMSTTSSYLAISVQPTCVYTQPIHYKYTTILTNIYTAITSQINLLKTTFTQFPQTPTISAAKQIN